MRQLGSESLLSLISCVTLNKSLYLSGPLFCHLSPGNNDALSVPLLNVNKMVEKKVFGILVVKDTAVIRVGFGEAESMLVTKILPGNGLPVFRATCPPLWAWAEEGGGI